MSVSTQHPDVGTCIGSYRLVRRLGEGGMGTVYEAQHTLIERRAAIKLLHSELVTQRGSVQRFLNEARAINRVRHPGLVEILELGELPDGAPYLVMELLVGETLAARIAPLTRWPLGLAIDIARQIAEAMVAAHVHGIVHRDLKPSNLMLLAAAESAAPARVKVLDFGIAKLLPAELPKRSADPLTRSQAVLGTAEYMAPEQCRDARTVDAKADVYALGIILYELLAGQRPFAAPTALEVMLLQVQSPPPFLKSCCPDLNDDLLALVHQMLAKDPHERPAMAAVAQQLASDRLTRPRQLRTVDDLRAAPLTIEGISLSPKTAAFASRRRQALWTLLGAISLALVMIGAGSFLRRAPSPHSAAIIVSSETNLLQPSIIVPRPPIAPAPIAAETGITASPAASASASTIAPAASAAPAAKASALRRPVSRPPVSASPPIFFKNKDPDGF